MKRLLIVMICGLLTFASQHDIKAMDEEAILIAEKNREAKKNAEKKESNDSKSAREKSIQTTSTQEPSKIESTNSNPINHSDASLPQAEPLNYKNTQNHKYSIDLENPIEVIQDEPIQAVTTNAFNLDNLQDVSPEPSTKEFKQKTTFTDYNARRTGQADPFKSLDAITKMDEAMKTLSDDLFDMDGADILKFEQFQNKLSTLKEQWITDPTQIKSADLSDFLNDFQSFAKKEMNSYSESSFARSSWQKMVDAIQDFIDILTGYDKQPTVVAQPVTEEHIINQNKALPQ